MQTANVMDPIVDVPAYYARGRDAGRLSSTLEMAVLLASSLVLGIAANHTTNIGVPWFAQRNGECSADTRIITADAHDSKVAKATVAGDLAETRNNLRTPKLYWVRSSLTTRIQQHTPRS